MISVYYYYYVRRILIIKKASSNNLAWYVVWLFCNNSPMLVIMLHCIPASGVARGATGAMAPQTSGKHLFSAMNYWCCYVLWMCKQTCEARRNLRESLEMAGDLNFKVCRKGKTFSQKWGHLIDLYLQLPKTISATNPPPSESGPLQEISATTPPANQVHLWRSRKIPATTPSPHWIWSAPGDHAKCTGWHQPGAPPKKKSWLRCWFLHQLGFFRGVQPCYTHTQC